MAGEEKKNTLVRPSEGGPFELPLVKSGRISLRGKKSLFNNSNFLPLRETDKPFNYNQVDPFLWLIYII